MGYSPDIVGGCFELTYMGCGWWWRNSNK
jgi:hypothetical protein